MHGGGIEERETRFKAIYGINEGGEGYGGRIGKVDFPTKSGPLTVVVSVNVTTMYDGQVDSTGEGPSPEYLVD